MYGLGSPRRSVDGDSNQSIRHSCEQKYVSVIGSPHHLHSFFIAMPDYCMEAASRRVTQLHPPRDFAPTESTTLKPKGGGVGERLAHSQNLLADPATA